MALSNNFFDAHLEGIFGKDVTLRLKRELQPLPTEQREQVILNALIEVFGAGRNYVLPFKFYHKEMLRTSHFIIFVTKNAAGCKIMKEIMYTHSAKDVDGVARFSFEDSFNFGDRPEQLSLFTRPLDALCDTLVGEHKGKQVLIKNLCDSVMRDTKSVFVRTNVQEALRRLESQGRVQIIGRKQKTRNGIATMPEAAFALFI